MKIYVQEYREPDYLVLIDIEYPTLRFIFDGIHQVDGKLEVNSMSVESSTDEDIELDLDYHAERMINEIFNSYDPERKGQITRMLEQLKRLFK